MSGAVQSAAPPSSLPDAPRAVRRCELDPERGGQFPLVGHHGEALDRLARQRLVQPAPGVPRLPGPDGTQGVRRVAYGYGARDAVQQTALGVRRLYDVDRLGPAVEGPVHVVDRAGPQQQRQGVEAEFTAHPWRVAQADGRRRLRTADDDRAAGGLDHLDRDRIGPCHLDGFLVCRRGAPAVRPQCLHGLAPAPQFLLVEVLVVGHGVGDRPGDGRGVSEVRDAGDAGNGQPDDVELRAGQAGSAGRHRGLR